MSECMGRRGFLQQTALMLGAGCAAGPARLAGAIEPIQRGGNAQFKFSLAAYSYRRLLQGEKGKSPQLTLADFIDDCARFGLQAAELTGYYMPKQPSDEYLAGLKAHAFRQGLDVSGTAIRNELCHPPGEKRASELAHVKRWVDYAEKLDAPVIRIFSGNAGKGQSVADAHRLAVEGLEECCDYAGKHGVYLALENHGGLTAKVDGLLALVRDVKSPWFGVNMDTGNFRDTNDAYADLARIAPYALNVQVKVLMTPSGRQGKEQPTDFSRLAAILRDTGYRGYVVLEYEEEDDPREACPRYLEQLRAAFA